jgi:hypothetical protein
MTLLVQLSVLRLRFTKHWALACWSRHIIGDCRELEERHIPFQYEYPLPLEYKEAGKGAPESGPRNRCCALKLAPGE